MPSQKTEYLSDSPIDDDDQEENDECFTTMREDDQSVAIVEAGIEVESDPENQACVNVESSSSHSSRSSRTKHQTKAYFLYG